MGTFGNTNQTLIRHDFKRACYRTMLSEFTIPEIKEFFAKVPLVINGKEYRDRDLYELLWQEKSKVPASYDIATDNELEHFLLAKGRCFRGFMKKILWLNNNSSVMPGKVLLSWFYPKLESLFSALDARDLVFSLLTLHNENWLPGMIHRRVKKWEEDGWIKSMMVFIPDSTFREYLDWDLEWVGGPQILASPGMVGLPHFEKFGMVSDTRPVERVIWRQEDRCNFSGDALLIAGQPYGKRISFEKFWRKADLELEKFSPPDVTVVEMDRDYFCSIRERIVLHGGCAYGAPFYLHTVEHRKLNLPKKDFLGGLVSDLVREDELHQDELESKHRLLLDSLLLKCDFKYFLCDESITLNDVHFVKGIPAKMLKFLLESYVSEGKREFEYRELKRSFERHLGPKNSNFEVRFYRLADKLESESTGLRIEKTGRGRFRLHVRDRIQFQSISN